MLMQKLLASAGEEAKLYSDDVFQAFTRTGTGADATVTTGIDMTKGYMLWSKGRSGATDHAIYDAARGPTYDLASNTTAAQTTQATGLKSVSATGHTIGSLAKMNTSGATYVDFVIRKAPKFFDVVTYTGDGVAGRQIPHALGIAPGMVIVKKTSGTDDWGVYHRSISATKFLYLNSTAAQATASSLWNDTEPTSSVFTIGGSTTVNQNTATYVAYLFAHDPSADGIIQCGTIVGTTSYQQINLGWEPQYVLLKAFNTVTDWWVMDTSRGLSLATDQLLRSNTSGAESSLAFINPNAQGIEFPNASGTSYIYLAIRRPNKPPTTGTQVYNAISRNGNGTNTKITGVGFSPDLVVAIDRRATNSNYKSWFDRLRGPLNYLNSRDPAAESSAALSLTSFEMDGVSVGTDFSTGLINKDDIGFGNPTYINHFFKRAPGVFDVVCYTGNSNTTYAKQTLSHSLQVAPELVIWKSRSAAYAWRVFSKFTGSGYETGQLHLSEGFGSASYSQELLVTAQPTANTIQVGNVNQSPPYSLNMNELGVTHILYLFATKPGISKVFSYTGNGTSQTIDCGFTTGARFVMIKRTDSTGDWYIWDTVRGLVAGNDPHLSLNTTAAEVTTNDSLDPANSGFVVNQLAATNINVTSASYIYLSFS